MPAFGVVETDKQSPSRKQIARGVARAPQAAVMADFIVQKENTMLKKLFVSAGLVAMLAASSAFAGENPCAGKNPCAMKGNPCAMKANPCAMKGNPCAMKHHSQKKHHQEKTMNPCAAKNPCAGKM